MKRLLLVPIFAALNFFGSPAAAQVNPFNPDIAWCKTQGAIAYRNATKWGCLNPGTAGNALVTQGAGANPTWSAVGGTGTVTSVAQTVPSFLTVTGSPVTGSGTLAITANTQSANTVLAGPTSGGAATPAFRALGLTDFPSIASGGILSNVTGGSTTPSANNLSALLDFGISSARGSMAYRSTGGWVALAPGTSGQFLQTAGAGADPLWAAVSGATGGTVTTITAGTGITLSSGATCTLTCTVNNTGVTSVTGNNGLTGTVTTTGNIGLATIATGNVLANVSGSTAVPTAQTPSAVLDTISSTQGTILYRNASAWVALSPGTAGQVLQTGGAAANPSWASAGGSNYTLVATWTSGTSNTVTGLSSYNDLLFVANNMASNTSPMSCDWSTNNGSSYAQSIAVTGALGAIGTSFSVSVTGLKQGFAHVVGSPVSASNTFPTSASSSSTGVIAFAGVSAAITAVRCATDSIGSGSIKVYAR